MAWIRVLKLTSAVH